MLSEQGAALLRREESSHQGWKPDSIQMMQKGKSAALASNDVLLTNYPADSSIVGGSLRKRFSV